MTLARHVAAECDENGGAESEFVGAEHRRHDDVARGAQGRHRCAGGRVHEGRCG